MNNPLLKVVAKRNEIRRINPIYVNVQSQVGFVWFPVNEPINLHRVNEYLSHNLMLSEDLLFAIFMDESNDKYFSKIDALIFINMVKMEMSCLEYADFIRNLDMEGKQITPTIRINGVAKQLEPIGGVNFQSWETTTDVQRHVMECILYLKHYSEKGILLLDNMISNVINDWEYCIHTPVSPVILSRYDKKYDVMVYYQIFCNDFVSKFCLNESYRIDEKDGKSTERKGLLVTEFMNIISDFIHEWKDVDHDKTYAMFSFIFNLNYGRAGVYSYRKETDIIPMNPYDVFNAWLMVDGNYKLVEDRLNKYGVHYNIETGCWEIPFMDSYENIRKHIMFYIMRKLVKFVKHGVRDRSLTDIFPPESQTYKIINKEPTKEDIVGYIASMRLEIINLPELERLSLYAIYSSEYAAVSRMRKSTRKFVADNFIKRMKLYKPNCIKNFNMQSAYKPNFMMPVRNNNKELLGPGRTSFVKLISSHDLYRYIYEMIHGKGKPHEFVQFNEGILLREYAMRYYGMSVYESNARLEELFGGPLTKDILKILDYAYKFYSYSDYEDKSKSKVHSHYTTKILKLIPRSAVLVDTVHKYGFNVFETIGLNTMIGLDEIRDTYAKFIEKGPDRLLGKYYFFYSVSCKMTNSWLAEVIVEGVQLPILSRQKETIIDNCIRPKGFEEKFNKFLSDAMGEKIY